MPYSICFQISSNRKRLCSSWGKFLQQTWLDFICILPKKMLPQQIFIIFFEKNIFQPLTTENFFCKIYLYINSLRINSVIGWQGIFEKPAVCRREVFWPALRFVFPVVRFWILQNNGRFFRHIRQPQQEV